MNYQDLVGHDVTLHLKHGSFRGVVESYKNFTFHLKAGIDDIYVLGEVLAITQHGLERGSE